MPASTPARQPTSATPHSRALAHKAFWVMTRRVTVMAAGVDLAFVFLFLAFGSPLLAWLNVVSITMYAVAYWLLGRRINGPAVVLIWIEVLGHAAIGTLLIGWDSGFHYYLLMFIPAIVVSAGTRLVPYLLLVLLFVFYTGLHAISLHLGPLAPLNARALLVVHGFNVAVVFAMAAYTARFYYATVRRAEKRLAEQAATDPLTGLSNRRNLLTLAEQVQAQALRTNLPTALVIADIDQAKTDDPAVKYWRNDMVAFMDEIDAYASGLALAAVPPPDLTTVDRYGRMYSGSPVGCEIPDRVFALDPSFESY